MANKFSQVMIKNILPFLLVIAVSIHSYAQEGISSYYQVASLSTTIDEASATVSAALESKGFEIIGQYAPEGNKDLYVMAFTRNDLQQTTLKVKDRGALAGVLKVGFVLKEGKVNVSVLNPEYLFMGYLRSEYATHKKALEKINDDVFAAMAQVGSQKEPFGGSLEPDKLMKYHYMFGMPYFDDPVTLNEFDSFEAGVNKIRANLSSGKGNTKKVYEVIHKDKKVAVFGIALLDPEEGEGNILPIIGEDHIAAMPYEIIVEGTKATMLHGRFRFALHWPELTMGTFTKIMSSPGDVKDALEALTE